MKNCASCKTQIVPSKCIISEEELSFEYNSFDELLQNLDKNTQDLNKILTQEVDKKWITTNRQYITQYIQDLINKLDLVDKQINNQTETKYNVNTTLVSGEKSALQLFNIIFKKLEDHDKQLNNNLSSMYLV